MQRFYVCGLQGLSTRPPPYRVFMRIIRSIRFAHCSLGGGWDNYSCIPADPANLGSVYSLVASALRGSIRTWGLAVDFSRKTR